MKLSKILKQLIIGQFCIVLLIHMIGSNETIATDQAAPQQINDSSKTSFAPIVKKVAPAVVDLVVAQVANNTVFNPFSNDTFFNFFFGGNGLLDDSPRVFRSSGSGVIISPEGVLVTCAHVVEEGAKITVVLHDGRELSAKIIKIDGKNDLAFLQISLEKDEKLPFLKLGDSDSIEVGDKVLAIGNSFGLGQTVTDGIISAKSKLLGNQYLIQTSAAINPGNSGGALINLYGELIGVNNAIISKSGGWQGVGFTIPSNLVLAKSNVNAKSPWLGISVQSISPELAQSIPGYNEKRITGVLVTRIHGKSPLKEAGLKQGDIILKFNQHEVNKKEKFLFHQETLLMSKDINFEILRNGEKLNIHCTSIEAPGDEKTVTFSQGFLKGLIIGESSPSLAQKYNFDETVTGVVVLGPPTQGIFAQLYPEDIIKTINGKEINSLSEAESILKNIDDHKGITLQLKRGKQNIEIFVNNNTARVRQFFDHEQTAPLKDSQRMLENGLVN